MSRRLWGAYASQQGVLGTALRPERLSLRLSNLDENPVSWGIGFYERSEPLVRKCPLEERKEIDLAGVLAETHSDLLIGHVRSPTVGALSAENTHPFRFRQWLFAQSGTVARFADIKEKMQHAMPSFLQRSLSGDTDSQCLFHLVLAILHDSRQLENPRLGPDETAEALCRALVMVDELASQAGAPEPSAVNIIMSNGAFLLALRRSESALKCLTYVEPSREEVHPRAVLLACDKTAVGPDWSVVPERSIVKVRRDISLEIRPL